MLETQKMIEILINIAIFLVVVLVIAICIGWINNKTKDKKVHTEDNNINNSSNNVLTKAIKSS